MCPKLRAGTRWVGAAGARAVGPVHQRPGASVRRQEPQAGHRREPHAAAERVGASRRADVRRRPYAALPLPSSSLSILCEFP
jgi:hypothetical protein